MRPDTAVDVARVRAVDCDVPVFRQEQEAVLQLCEPGLVPELVVLVVLHAVDARVALLAVEVAEAEFAEEVEAGCCADYAGFVCFGDGGEDC